MKSSETFCKAARPSKEVNNCKLSLNLKPL